MAKPHLMGDHAHGHSFAGQIGHDIQHFTDHLRVKGRCGLVKEHDLRRHGKAPGNGHPLLLAAGELGRICVCLVGEAPPGPVFP